MIDIVDPNDLEISHYDPRPPGGQRVGSSSGVRVEHLPTGTVAIVMTNRSQHRNRILAQRMIEAALTDPEWCSDD